MEEPRVGGFEPSVAALASEDGSALGDGSGNVISHKPMGFNSIYDLGITIWFDLARSLHEAFPGFLHVLECKNFGQCFDVSETPCLGDFEEGGTVKG